MRYVIVDLYGASREHLDSAEELMDVLREIEDDAAGSTAELFVVTYDEDGNRLDQTRRADEVLAEGPRVDSASAKAK